MGGGTSIMMGFKERAFAPLVAVSLEELVPQDHFYRHVQKVLDLSFVYDLVRESYALAGRPSIDPVVFFKLQLVMFFEDIRSERLLMRQVADRLSVRWYLGYDLDEPLPDHSSLTKIRTRYGVQVGSRASLTALSSSANRQDWSGASSCTSTVPRSKPMPLKTHSNRAFLSRPISAAYSMILNRGLKSQKASWKGAKRALRKLVL
jgi:Transposase domain (DUF772)